MKILVLNSGSSSQKMSVYHIANAVPKSPPPPIWKGKVEWNGEQAEVQVQTSQGEGLKKQTTIGSRQQGIDLLLDSLCSGKTRAVSKSPEIDVVGHRIVNGGQEYEKPTVITSGVKTAIAKMSAFAPLHNRVEMEGINIIEKRFGAVPQVAVFDTGFHSRLPESAFVYPGPYEWLARGIRRYGFHGINHQYCAERTAQLLGKKLSALKLVTCHLGNGCSLSAIRNGHSVDTTMGFTPLEGLMMGTRSGSVDPGILTYLMRQGGLTAEQLDQVLNTQSGLLGISGRSGDMRDILTAMKEGDERATLAFDIYIHRLQSGIGSMIGVLGGLDALVFSGGVVENSPEVRAGACENFGFLGIKLDAAKNAQSPPDANLAAPESSVPVLIIRAQEDWQIARECWALASRGDS